MCGAWSLSPIQSTRVNTLSKMPESEAHCWKKQTIITKLHILCRYMLQLLWSITSTKSNMKFMKYNVPIYLAMEQCVNKDKHRIHISPLFIKWLLPIWYGDAWWWVINHLVIWCENRALVPPRLISNSHTTVFYTSKLWLKTKWIYITMMKMINKPMLWNSHANICKTMQHTKRDGPDSCKDRSHPIVHATSSAHLILVTID